MRYVRSLTELGRQDLLSAGGKGANLGELLRAGQPVPPGFCVLTTAYAEFVRENSLSAEISRFVGPARAARAGRAAAAVSLDSISEAVQALFTGGRVPPSIADEVGSAYLSLGGPRLSVAVRSSATAEDLPDASFAGQQDTYLNVVGPRGLMEAVVRCWASLWTARAIDYRDGHGVSHSGIALAVVVQSMVESESSGVIFTANPLTGGRRETVIDATLGLGEALVSGQVEPDHYVVSAGRITGRTLGAKALSTRSRPEGGTVTVAETAAPRPALTDPQILELETRGRQIEAHFGSPQDIEWAWADGRVSILQSRPITSLYPLPSGVPEGQLLVLFSLAGIQGMFDPFTPLGYDTFRSLVAVFGRIFGLQRTVDTQRGMFVAGNRLWLNLTALFRSKAGRKMLNVLVSFIDPGSRAAVDGLLEDARFGLEGGITARTLRGFAWIFFRLVPRLIANLVDPEGARVRLFRTIDAMETEAAGRLASLRGLDERLEWIRRTVDGLPPVFFGSLVPAVASGMAAQNILRVSCRGLPDMETWIMRLTRGLPYNVTTEMDLALWEAARAIRSDPAAARHMTDHEPAVLAAHYGARALPAAALAAIDRFLGVYGMRAVGEIDIGRPRWREEPTSLIQALSSYLRISNETVSPDEVFRRAAASAEQAAGELLKTLRALPGGKRRARGARFAIKRIRALAGLREAPKFAAIRVFSFMRQGLLASGAELTRAGILGEPNDVFFLLLDELQAIAAGEPGDWKRRVAERRQVHEREKRRRQVPRLMLSDGTAYYEGVGGKAESGDDGRLHIPGSPVSPGVAEGLVRVVLDPRTAGLAPGEILVCVGTDPAWTPLFLAAGALVMEVGGMMTHGSVVAREYGIPAVVGVSRATTRLSTGQHVRVDGNSGTVTVL